MKGLRSILTVAFVLSLILSAQALISEREAAAWGLPEGFNPETGKIEKTSDSHQASRLIGTIARNERGDRLGTVEDILFSNDGRVTYLILARREFEGVERLVPVPWKEAKAEIRDARLVLDLDRNVFDNAPSFARDNWDRLDDPQWNRTVHSYY